MKETLHKVIQTIWMAAILCFTPLFGVLYCELPLAPYLEFPPLTKHIQHASFQWPAFVLLFLFVAIICFPLLCRYFTYNQYKGNSKRGSNPFPWWGWLGGAIVLAFWLLAWNRFSFFHHLQHYTFFPLWIGYTLVVNGLTQQRLGTCLLRSQPRFFWTLFPVSAVFWWYFEYLNRFVQNWHYLGVEDFSAAEYVIHASICFSTVLPAVLSTNEFLGTFPRLVLAFTKWRPVNFSKKKEIGWLLLAGAVISLGCLVVYPDYLFPLVWISPLLVIVGIQLVTKRHTVFAGVENGNWRYIVLPALAALICGLFWEMWNWKSLAHWEYSVPFVHRFQIFAMPLLGYAGYLPFGLECVAVGSLVNIEKD